MRMQGIEFLDAHFILGKKLVPQKGKKKQTRSLHLSTALLWVLGFGGAPTSPAKPSGHVRHLLQI